MTVGEERTAAGTAAGGYRADMKNALEVEETTAMTASFQRAFRGECHACGKIGHMARDCKSSNASGGGGGARAGGGGAYGGGGRGGGGSSKVKCSKCDKHGHIRRFCQGQDADKEQAYAAEEYFAL